MKVGPHVSTVQANWYRKKEEEAKGDIEGRRDDPAYEEPNMSCRGKANGLCRLLLGYFFFLGLILGLCFSLSILVQISFLMTKASRHDEYVATSNLCHGVLNGGGYRPHQFTRQQRSDQVSLPLDGR